MARRLARNLTCVGCGRSLRLELGVPATAVCPGCGLDYDPGTGEVLPVCEGLPPLAAKILPLRAPTGRSGIAR